jgi:uncharacterized protein (DUF1501 family)
MHSTRRRFLQQTITAVAASSLVPWSGAGEPRPRRRERGERVLVVLELEGGNDGLNTVIPLRRDGYVRARPTLAAVASAAHPIGGDFGLHPQLAGCAQRLHDGRLAVLHGVGYAHPDRSHFRSMDIWHTGLVPGGAPQEERGPGIEIDRRTATGWLGRLASAAGDDPLWAVHVGAAPVPLALAVRGRQGLTVDEEGLAPRAPRAAAWSAALAAQSAARPDDGEELRSTRDAARAALDLEARLTEAAAFEPRAAWPDSGLARELRAVAALVSSGFPARIYTLRLSGFDTHTSQLQRHRALLETLDRAICAFDEELRARGRGGDAVTLVFSEFGRRVAENGARGTDHGAAGPVLLLGGGVRGGHHGIPPDLDRLEDGDLVHSTDFRSLYGAVERHWFGQRTSWARPVAGLFAE